MVSKKIRLAQDIEKAIVLAAMNSDLLMVELMKSVAGTLFTSQQRLQQTKQMYWPLARRISKPCLSKAAGSPLPALAGPEVEKRIAVLTQDFPNSKATGNQETGKQGVK